MNVKKLDLIAVHNLVDWKTHLSTLKKWKEEGKVRYIGITTSHGRYRSELIKIMQTEEIDFVQFSYNIEDRDAEFDLFPLARRRGIATMINRPFKRGSLFKITKDQSLPEVAKDLEIYSWAQFFLKFILSNPAVTNIIPATSKKHHMIDNMKANKGVIPTPIQRQEMLNAFMRIRNNF
jgi:diketogulonate reductase-like aldo/keto reductase